MHCASCKAVLEKTLLQLAGVKTASVNFGTEVLTIVFDTNITNEQEIKGSIENVGNYSISPYSYELKKESKILEYKQLKRKIILLGIICLPFTILMIGMMAPFINELLMEYSFLNLLVQFAGASLAIYLGKDIYKGAWSSIKNRKANMDVLIAMGTFTAYFYSTLVSFVPKFQGMHVDSYFEATVFIIFFIMLGRFLEMKSKGQTSSAVEELLKLSAKDAIKLENGIQTKIAIDLLKVGDIVLVKTGEKVPLDGEIIEGQAYIDESMITGEPIAVLKVQET
jgi:Cu+-exporting ATPase